LGNKQANFIKKFMQGKKLLKDGTGAGYWVLGAGCWVPVAKSWKDLCGFCM
jgi:hypothetical protein